MTAIGRNSVVVYILDQFIGGKLQLTDSGLIQQLYYFECFPKLYVYFKHNTSMEIMFLDFSCSSKLRVFELGGFQLFLLVILF